MTISAEYGISQQLPNISVPKKTTYWIHDYVCMLYNYMGLQAIKENCAKYD